MKVLVTGVGGQLGFDVCRRLNQLGIANKGVDIQDFDLTDGEAVLHAVKDYAPDAIIHCAAYTNVEKAETLPEACAAVNETGTRNVAQAALAVNAKMMYISTDYVFGLEPYNTPCNEEQKGTPTGVYGHSKLRGEMVIRNSGVQYLILRTSWLYSEYGRNFCRTMMKLTAEKPQVNVVFDQTGTPTYALDLAQAITTILERESWRGNTGIYNYSNEGVCSWYDFAMTIRKMAGHEACQINPCHSSEYPSPVKRPAYSVLDKSKFKQTFHLSIPYWAESLLKCVNNLKGNI